MAQPATIPLHLAGLALCLASVGGCYDETLVGTFLEGQGGTSGAGGGGTGGAAATPCEIRECQQHVYACGDCVDNDADGLVDADDPDCFGPCQNLEDFFFGGIPGQTGGGCRQDCYFDQDSGAGNDGCEWDHRCDSLAAPPDYPPQGDQCEHDPSLSSGSPPRTCDELSAEQPDTCAEVCGPLIPNGCDCFGCCSIPGAPGSVWLGSQVNGLPSCSLSTLEDPERCRPCTQVPSCLNPCEDCELCIGKQALPDSCGTDTDQQCPLDWAPCGLQGQAACKAGTYCVTGCCAEIVK